MNLKEVMGTKSSQSRIEAVFYTTQYRHLINMNVFIITFPLLSLTLLIYESQQTYKIDGNCNA